MPVSPFIPVPAASDLVLRNLRIPGCLLNQSEELVSTDIRITDGLFAAIGPALPPGGAEVDCRGGIAMAGLVDLHTHLDKGQIWPRADNPDGTHRTAANTVKADREANWSAEDVAARFEFNLRCAYAHGTVAIRTHIDSLGPQKDISWPVFEEMRKRWAGRITLQGVSLMPLAAFDTPFADALGDTVAAAGGLLGGSGALEPNAPALIERVFAIAADRNIGIDLHVDETLDPAAHTLRLIAQETIRRGYQGRVNCGHCCSLSAQDPAEARETIALVADAGVSVVSLPMVNLYLQGRVQNGTPRYRGITMLHELRAAGVRTSVASDNARDPFYAYGDLDLAEVLREAVRIGHLDLPVGDWPRAVTTTPAAVMGLETIGLRAGGAADLAVFAARSYSELFSRPQSDRLVLRHGRPIDTNPPAYSDLDGLKGFPYD
jgi:cytosine deaminase